MQEKTIEKKLREQIQAKSGMALKFSSPYYTGMPDRIVLMPGGRICFVELKKPGETPTERQKVVHAKLRGLGFSVAVVDSVESLEAFMEGLKNEF